MPHERECGLVELNRIEICAKFWKGMMNIRIQFSSACCLLLISSSFFFLSLLFFCGGITYLFQLLPVENGFTSCQVHLWNKLLTAALSVPRIMFLKQKVVEYSKRSKAASHLLTAAETRRKHEELRLQKGHQDRGSKKFIILLLKTQINAAT